MALPHRSVLRQLVQDCAARREQTTPKTYLRAATQWLDFARVLIEVDGLSTLHCVYLAGYIAECSLKSLIMQRTPRKRWPALREALRTHNIDQLRNMLEVRSIPLPPEVSEALGQIAGRWVTDFRYFTNSVEKAEGREFLTQVESIFLWTQRSLS